MLKEQRSHCIYRGERSANVSDPVRFIAAIRQASVTELVEGVLQPSKAVVGKAPPPVTTMRG
jgi:hypothetical protein